MLYYIEAKVSIKVAGISGPWDKTPTYLVNAPSVSVAKQKFEDQVRRDNANMEAQSFKFEYLKIAGEI